MLKSIKHEDVPEKYKKEVYDLKEKIEDLLEGHKLDTCLNALGICAGCCMKELIEDDRLDIDEKELKKSIFTQIEQAYQTAEDQNNIVKECPCHRCVNDRARTINGKGFKESSKNSNPENKTEDQLLSEFYNDLTESIYFLRSEEVSIMRIVTHLMAQICNLAITTSNTFEIANGRMKEVVRTTQSRFKAMWDARNKELDEDGRESWNI